MRVDDRWRDKSWTYRQLRQACRTRLASLDSFILVGACDGEQGAESRGRCEGDAGDVMNVKGR